MRNLGLRYQLLALTAPALAASLILAFLLFSSMNRLDRAYRSAAMWDGHALAIEQVKSATFQYLDALRSVLLTGSGNATTVEGAGRTLKEALERSGELAQGFDEAERQEEGELSKAGSALLLSGSSLADRRRDGASAADLMDRYQRETLRLFEEEMLPKIQQRVEEEVAGSREFRRQASEVRKQSWILAIALAAATLILAIVTPLSVGRTLLRAIERLREGARRIGERDWMHRVHIEAGPELQELSGAFNEMSDALRRTEETQMQKEQLEREIKLAKRIQTSILPKRFAVEGVDISARMIPATHVGGDYYDVLPAEGGCWFAVGDVAGHGLTAGLVMLMLQSSIATLALGCGGKTPSELLDVANAVIRENVRRRLDQPEHATLSLLRFRRDGHITMAGAHQDLLVSRADSGLCETLETQGTWLGLTDNIKSSMPETSFQLGKGDVLLLYSDGLTEAMDEAGEMFGIERVREELQRVRDQPVEKIQEHLFEAVMKWRSGPIADDVSIMAIRYVG